MSLTYHTNPGSTRTSQDTRLPVEIWSLVLQHLEGCVTDLSTLSLASEDVRHLAQPILFRRLTLGEPLPRRHRMRHKSYEATERDKKQLNRLIGLEEIFQDKLESREWPRTLEVHFVPCDSWPFGSPYSKQITECMINILLNLTRVESVSLTTSGLPIDVVDEIWMTPTLHQRLVKTDAQDHRAYRTIRILKLKEWRPIITCIRDTPMTPQTISSKLRSLQPGSAVYYSLHSSILGEGPLFVFENLTELDMQEPGKGQLDAFVAFWRRCPNVTKLSLHRRSPRSALSSMALPNDVFPGLRDLSCVYGTARNLLSGRDVRRFVDCRDGWELDWDGDPAGEIHQLAGGLEEWRCIAFANEIADIPRFIHVLTLLPRLSTLTLGLVGTHEAWVKFEAVNFIRMVSELTGLRSFVARDWYRLTPTSPQYGILEASRERLRDNIAIELPSLGGSLEHVRFEMYRLEWRRRSSGVWEEVEMGC